MDDFPSGNYGTWPACKDRLPHAVELLANTPNDDLATISLLIKVVRYLILTTQYPLAEEYVTRLYTAATSSLGGADPTRLAAVCLSVRYLTAMEKPWEAEGRIESARAAARTAHGDKSIHTLQCNYWLAITINRLGKTSAAITILREVLSTANQSFKPDHFALRIQHLLSSLLRQAGNFRDAKAMIESVVEGQTRVLSPGNPSLLESRDDLAWSHILEGQTTKALSLAEANLADCKRHLGTEHVQSCVAAYTYAKLSSIVMDYRAVDSEMPWASENIAKALGVEHRLSRLLYDSQRDIQLNMKMDINTNTLFKHMRDGVAERTGIPLAEAVVMLGTIGNEAFARGEKVCGLEKIWISVDGWEHLRATGAVPASRDGEIVPVMLVFAARLADIGRGFQAEEQYWKALNLARTAFGWHDRQSLAAAVALARFLHSKFGRSGHAAKLLQATLAGYRTHMKSDDPDMYDCIMLLAECECQTEKFQLAIDHFLEACKYYRRPSSYSIPKALAAARGAQDAQAKAQSAKPEPKGTSWSMETLVLHAAAAAGSFNKPSLTPADWAVSGAGSTIDLAGIPPPRSAELCQQCRRITLRSLLQSCLHPGLSVDSPRRSLVPMPGCVPLEFKIPSPPKASRDCRCCKLLLGSLARLDAPVTFTLYAEPKNKPDFFASMVAEHNLQDGKHNNRLLIYTPRPGTLASKHMPTSLVEDPISERVIGKIRRWLQECDECHTDCFIGLSEAQTGEDHRLPTRAIFVPPDGSDPHLVVTNELRSRYIALSHCWGGQTGFVCTRSNLVELCRSIPLASLSKTVRDAVDVCRRLTIRYLWVDSLCIVQDDKQDWLREAPQMGSVYEHAYLTLAATAAANGSVGLLAPLEHEDILHLPCDPSRPDGDAMCFVPHGITFHEVQESPLNHRGWVLQERLLSRRTIHFAATQVYWECQEWYRAENEQVPKTASGPSNRGQQLRLALSEFPYADKPRGAGGRGKEEQEAPAEEAGPPSEYPGERRRFGREYKLQAAWRGITCFYSSRKLTYAADKLPALAGIVSKIKSRTGLDYQYGHWFGQAADTTIGLLWAASGTPLTRPAEPRAPSWSWAALDGAIEFLMDHVDAERLIEQTDDLKVLEIAGSPGGLGHPMAAVGADAEAPEPAELRCSGVVRSAQRCPHAAGGHQPVSNAISRSPYPRSGFYHLGPECAADYDWFPKPLAAHEEPRGERRDVRFALEFFAKMFPQRAMEQGLQTSFQEMSLDGGAASAFEPVLEPVSAPGIGWVCFDTAEEPAAFELLRVCTRQFLGRRRVATPQHLALACVPCEGPGEARRYRRVGVAQIHQRGWFDGIAASEFTLV